MIPAPTLPWFELARFGRSRLTRVAVVAVLAVPLFYGGLYLWANLDPTGRTDQVQAAVVNDDEAIELEGPDGEPQAVAIGRQLAGNLISDDSSENYDWVLTDAGDAQQGLSDGDYKAVLTIPENLSEAATSTDDPDTAVQGNLDLVTNDAVNYLNGAVAQTILQAARTALNTQVTETYLENIYLGFSDIRLSLDEAADGADELANGAGRLSGGARELAAGTGELASGAEELAAGNRQLAAGAGELDDGAGELAGGLQQLDEQTAPLAGQSRELADGAEQVADGVAQLDRTVQTATGAILAATADADQLSATLQALAAQCRDAAPEGLDCADLEEAAASSDAVVRQVREQASAAGTQTRQLSDGARRVADGNAELAAGVPALVGAIGEASDGAAQLASATGRLASGADRAATGADQLAAGSGELAAGADALADGADELSVGALQLRDGLREGAGEVPDYTEDERDTLATTAATPVEDAADRVNAVSSFGSGIAPYFMALALWFGAMAIYLLLRPLSERALASTAGALPTALAGFAPGAVLALVQALLLVGLVVGVVGIDPARPLVLVGFAVLTALVFTALNQAFVALFGGAGRVLALVFVALQLTAAGGTYPIETSPGFFGFLHTLLPMTYAVEGMRTAIAGGDTGLAAAAVVLVAFTLLGIALTVLAAHRRQVVTMSRLHPVLRV